MKHIRWLIAYIYNWLGRFTCASMLAYIHAYIL